MNESVFRTAEVCFPGEPTWSYLYRHMVRG
jgi:hypothetical protein